MKIDKDVFKSSGARITMLVVAILCFALAIFVIGQIAFPEPEDEAQHSQGESQSTIEDTPQAEDIKSDEKSDKTVISVESITIPKGTDEVTVNIQVSNNPGIMGAVLKLSVDDMIFGFEKGTQIGYPGMMLTSPGPAVTSSPYTFMLDAMELSDSDRGDGTLFAVTLNVKDANATGKFDVTLSCEEGAIFDEEYIDLDVIIKNGTITIE